MGDPLARGTKIDHRNQHGATGIELVSESIRLLHGLLHDLKLAVLQDEVAQGEGDDTNPADQTLRTEESPLCPRPAWVSHGSAMSTLRQRVQLVGPVGTSFAVANLDERHRRDRRL